MEVVVVGDHGNDEALLLEEEIAHVEGMEDYKGRKAKRSESGGWRSASLIVGVEMMERFSFNGVSANLITYLTGPLGQSTVTASQNINTFVFASCMLPLLGAFVSDSYLGRYRTILFSSILYVLGLGLLALSVMLSSLSPTNCQKTENNTSCASPSPIHVVFFFSSLYLVALAQGGYKPNIQAFGADQFDEQDPKECKSKSSFFNWWNFGLCVSVSLSNLILINIQENLSWSFGMGIPCAFMLVSLIAFLLGTKTYRYSTIGKDENNPFVRIYSMSVVAALRNWNWGSAPSPPTVQEEPVGASGQDSSLKFKYLDDEALGVDISDNRQSQVEEAKVAILRLIPIWCICLTYTILYTQPAIFFTKQGSTMDRSIGPKFKISAATLLTIIPLSMVLFIPIYDRVFVPIARVFTGKRSGITMLQRIGCGIVFSIITMGVAAIVEKKRLQSALDSGIVDVPGVTVPMSVWWLVPQYVLVGVSDVFAVVGLQEFFYDQVPKGMRSLGIALFLSLFGLGSFLNDFLISIIEKTTGGGGRDSWFSDNLNRGHLDYFYWLLTGTSTLGFAAYLYFAKSYRGSTSQY